MKLKDWYLEHHEPGNILMPPMKPDDAASILLDELFDGACINYPCSAEQALAEAVAATVQRYRKLGFMERVMMLFARFIPGGAE